MARKGQFKKGGGRVGEGRSRRRSSTSKALTVYRPRPVVVTRTRHVKVPVRVHAKRGSGRSLMKREHGGGEIVPGPFRLRSAALSSLIGYSESGAGFTAIKELLDKLPDVKGIPREVLAGLALNYFADRGDWFDAGAQAFLDIGSYKFGQSGFKISGDEDDY